MCTVYKRDTRGIPNRTLSSLGDIALLASCGSYQVFPYPIPHRRHGGYVGLNDRTPRINPFWLVLVLRTRSTATLLISLKPASQYNAGSSGGVVLRCGENAARIDAASARFTISLVPRRPLPLSQKGGLVSIDAFLGPNTLAISKSGSPIRSQNNQSTVHVTCHVYV